ncbi:MAG: ribosome maturation factor RimP [Pseudomonadota bacterium]
MIALTAQEQRVLQLVEPVAETMGLEIVRVRIMGGRKPHLQIMIERAGGAPTNVEDCAQFSRQVSVVMDAEDPISEAYRLEVSTPGIDRPLTRIGDFGRWVGHIAKLELVMPIDNRRRFQGVIDREDDQGVAILLEDDTELVATIAEMSKASLILTDELIEAAREAGTMPPQPGDAEFDALETDEVAEETRDKIEEDGVDP